MFGTTPSGIDLVHKRLMVDCKPSNPAETSDALERLLTLPSREGGYKSEVGGGAEGTFEASEAGTSESTYERRGSSSVVATRLSAALAVQASDFSTDTQEAQVLNALDYDLLVAADGSRSQVCIVCCRSRNAS